MTPGWRSQDKQEGWVHAGGFEPDSQEAKEPGLKGEVCSHWSGGPAIVLIRQGKQQGAFRGGVSQEASGKQRLRDELEWGR